MNYLTITTAWKRCTLLSLSTLLLTAMGYSQFLGLESEVHATSEFGTTYRIYAEFGSATDECVAVYSVGALENNPVTLELGVTTAFYQNGGGANLGSGINAFFLSMIPEIGYDSWFTIGSETNADPTISAVGMADAFTEFNNGNGFILGEGAVGGSWYITPESNPLAFAGDDGMVLLGQFTAADDTLGNAGHVTCDWNIQWRDAADVSHNELGATHNTADNVPDVMGCMDEAACNYNPAATADDDSCEYLDALNECGGTCLADADADGICDDVDDCVGALDACGVCNGPGEIYECGCTEIPEGDCDCAGNGPASGYDCDGNRLAIPTAMAFAMQMKSPDVRTARRATTTPPRRMIMARARPSTSVAYAAATASQKAHVIARAIPSMNAVYAAAAAWRRCVRLRRHSSRCRLRL